MQWAGTGAPSHGATWQARLVGAVPARPLRAPASVPDTARAMAPAPAMTGPARPGTTTGVRPVLPWAAALAAGPSVAARSAAAASAAAPSVEWAAAPAMAAAVDADGNAAARQNAPPRCFGQLQRKNYLRFWGPEKPAGFSEPLFHGWGRGGKKQLPCRSWWKTLPLSFSAAFIMNEIHLTKQLC